MPPQDGKVVSLELSDHEAAYKAGRVDAVVTFGPARINLLKAVAIPLFDSSLIPGDIVDTLAASTQAIADNAENLKASWWQDPRHRIFFTGIPPMPRGAWPGAPR